MSADNQVLLVFCAMIRYCIAEAKQNGHYCCRGWEVMCVMSYLLLILWSAKCIHLVIPVNLPLLLWHCCLVIVKGVWSVK